MVNIMLELEAVSPEDKTYFEEKVRARIAALEQHQDVGMTCDEFW